MTSNATKIALVTGGNKGIGFAIAEELVKHKDLHVILGSRSLDRGKEALTKLKTDNASLVQLDLDDEKSIVEAAKTVKSKYGGLDILVNNAGMAFKGDAFDENVARVTLGTNYFGTLNAMKHFMPLVKENGRVVNVSSMAGQSALKRVSKELQEQFLKDNLTLDELTGLMNKFIKDVKEGQYAERGWPRSCYGVSKIGVTILTRIFARDNKTKGVLINSCCPGWVRTDMAGPRAPKSPQEGAETPVFLCFVPPNSPTGVFWSDKEVRPFVAP